MENASKALIIAGAILVSILIIGLGMTLYNNAAGTVNRANLDSTAVQQYNAEFVAYDQTDNVKGSNVRALITNVLTHNRANSQDPSLWINVHVDNGGSDTAMDDANNKVKANEHSNGAEEKEPKDLDSYNEAIDKALKDVRNARTYAVACDYDSTTGYVTDIEIVLNKR